MAGTTQFSVPLENKPGNLAKLCAVLRRAKVNITAISVAENTDACCVRFLATPTGAVKSALTKAKYHVSTQSVLAFRATNQQGELGDIAEKLAKAGVNINYVYGSTSGRADAVIVFAVDDLTKAAKALG
jgi:hypothetical protein